MTRTLLLTTALCLAAPATAQELALPDLSPRAEVMQTVGVVEITVNYASPGKRDRAIWGELVPYGELWRTGANGATTLESTGDIKVGGQEVPAGKYALFTIPGEEEWTVVLNTNADQGGTGRYDEKLDQARFTVKPVKGAERERLTFLFSDTQDDGATLELVWAGVKVPMAIEVDTAGMVSDGVESFAGDAAGRMANAARYFARNGDHDQALELIDQAMSMEQTWFNTWLKADFLHATGQNKAAYKAAQKAMELGEGDERFFWKDRVEKALAEWPKR